MRVFISYFTYLWLQSLFKRPDAFAYVQLQELWCLFMTITLVLFYETAKYIPEFCESICQARVAASCDDIMTYDALALSCRMMTCS